MPDNNLQKDLFNYIKTAVPPHIAMVDAVADLLDISHDSVYRRVRGEKPITLDELKLLCEHFHISLDQAIKLKTDSVVFKDYEASNPDFSFLNYLQNVNQQLEFINRFEKREMLYLAKDVPVFHFFLSEELTAFKSFFFEKSILNNPEFQGKTFNLRKFDNSVYYSLGKQILEKYYAIDSVELWNNETINSSILQIEYYRDAGLFENNDDMMAVIDALDKMLEHLQREAEKGHKFFPGVIDFSARSAFKLYVNEIVLGNNSVVVEMNGNKVAFINHMVLKYISTTDKRFTQKLFHNFNNLASRSTLISGTGEKDRNKFFKSAREKVLSLKK